MPFRMPARRERSIECRGPASESLRRTNPRGSGKLAVYGNERSGELAPLIEKAASEAVDEPDADEPDETLPGAIF